jgi:hypothetical protein
MTAGSIIPRRALAETSILLLNGNHWDVQDNTDPRGCPDDGSIFDGGEDAFDGFGGLHVRVLDMANNILVDDAEVCRFNLQWDGSRRWSTMDPVTVGTSVCGCLPALPSRNSESKTAKAPRFAKPVPAWVSTPGVAVSRAIFAHPGTDYIRYIDTFTNTGSFPLKVFVAFGGNLGSDEFTTIAGSSSGDLSVTTKDTWAVTIQNSDFNPAGPAADPPVGLVYRAANDTTFAGAGNYFNNPFITPWGGNGDDTPGYVFKLQLAPGESQSLSYFVYQGRAEGGSGEGARSAAAAATSEVSKALLLSAQLQASPDFGDLSPALRANIVNWPLEKFDSCLQDDSSPGNVLQFNSQTGDYQFCCNGKTYTGKATIQVRGQIITLVHNPVEYKLVATIDNAQHRGNAALQFPHGTTPCTIADRNTLNNTCVCGAL